MKKGEAFVFSIYVYCLLYSLIELSQWTSNQTPCMLLLATSGIYVLQYLKRLHANFVWLRFWGVVLTTFAQLVLLYTVSLIYECRREEELYAFSCFIWPAIVVIVYTILYISALLCLTKIVAGAKHKNKKAATTLPSSMVY